jgi:lantibiotic leader peptide-processing serine protease
MTRTNRFLALAATIVTAACSADSVVTPLKAPSMANLSKSVGRSGRYVALMQGSGLPKDFAKTVASLGGTVTSAHDGAGVVTISGLSDAAASQLATMAGVSEVDADDIVSLEEPVPAITADAAALSAPSAESQANPASALLASWQWNMRLIQADKAWAANKLGSPDVTVAILDTGLDYDNRDLTGLVDLKRSTSFMTTFVAESTETRLSDDAISATYFPSRNKISDYNGHGTNVAALVSSKAFAFAGVTSKTTLIGVKVLGSNGLGTTGGVLAGVLWAADNGADVANMSLGASFARAGNGQLVHVIKRVFDYAARKGTMVVVAAGNAATNLDRNGNSYAAYCDAPHVVCVSSVGPTTVDGNPDTPAFYTNYGARSIDVAAPGGNADIKALPISNWPWGADFASWVWSFCSRTSLVFNDAGDPAFAGCQGGNRLNGYLGTSQATPHVTGLAALLTAEYPKKHPERIKAIVENSGDPIARQYGGKRINVAAALGLIPRQHRDWDDRGSDRH